MQGLDEKFVKNIEESIVERGQGVTWDDISGLADIKRTLIENIVLP